MRTVSPTCKAPLSRFSRVQETLPQEVLDKMHAPAQDTSKVPLITPDKLATYDAFLMGIPTRYGNFPTQWKTFWDQTGQLWQKGGLWGKYAGTFFSTASMGGGQETTAFTAMTTLTHHGIIYVPFGYAKAFSEMVDLSQVRGGSAWGAGTIAVSPLALSIPFSGLSLRQVTSEPPADESIARAPTARANRRSASSASQRPRGRPSTRSFRRPFRDYPRGQTQNSRRLQLPVLRERLPKGARNQLLRVQPRNRLRAVRLPRRMPLVHLRRKRKRGLAGCPLSARYFRYFDITNERDTVRFETSYGVASR